MRTIILIAMFSLFSISTVSAESIATAFPKRSIRATDVVFASFNNFHATVGLEDDTIGAVLSEVSYDGHAATRCLDLVSDILAGKTPVSTITVYFEYENALTGSSGSVTPGGTASFDHLPITYNNVRIINCSATK